MDSHSKADPLTTGQREDAETDRMMDMKQILIFGLFLVPVWTSRCYEERELAGAAERKLQNRYPQPADPSTTVTSGSPASCPVELYQTQPPPREYSGRSLSPWRYIHVTKEDHFPTTYAEAQCLCSGCILFQDNSQLPEHSLSYNSVPLTQKRVFLKRELCSGNDDVKRYQLKPVNVEVAVGCTCVRVNYS
ncbi:interleukin-17C [Dicentrarchus labrax]|uniref:Interleukin 17 C n=1 Tax=Dicentrarchus labrax TaxID=13489 RepID=A0A076YF53_DICLA|nr:interleukin-17C [Dicentrarchus labrax]AIK66538.1 interleukin 17 C [Dicentrarchus labrax]